MNLQIYTFSFPLFIRSQVCSSSHKTLRAIGRTKLKTMDTLLKITETRMS